MILDDIEKDLRRCMGDAALLFVNPAIGPDNCVLRLRVASMRRSLAEAHAHCSMAILAGEEETYQPSAWKPSIDKGL